MLAELKLANLTIRRARLIGSRADGSEMKVMHGFVTKRTLASSI